MGKSSIPVHHVPQLDAADKLSRALDGRGAPSPSRSSEIV